MEKVKKNTITEIKKAELHCHLLGVLGPSLIKRIKEKKHILIDLPEFSSIYPVEGTIGFNQWLNITKPYQTAPLSTMLYLIELHLNDLASQNVVYTELMISPTIFPRPMDEMIRSFDFFRQEVNKLERGRTQVEFIMVIPRTLPDEKIAQDVIKFIELFKLGLIVGVALVGLENNQSMQRFYSHFSKLKDHGLGIEIHAGEHGPPQAVEEALSYGLADRIGHGISAFQSQSLMKKLQKINTHFELCITSNLKTGSVEDINVHPVLIAREMGLNYSINTDDPGIFQCSMNDEYQLLFDKLGFTIQDFNLIYKNSISSRFANKIRYLELIKE